MNVNNASEITIEVNPGTVTLQKLKDYKEAGINRLSIGLQSTENRILKQIGRIHNYEDFLETYNIAKEVGFNNINVDLMIGLPEQKISDIKKSLEDVINLECNHISVYSLIVEDDTVISKKIENGEFRLPSEDDERNMYWYVKNYLELNGYKHYEISNFSKSGFESKHNVDCWHQKEYRGFGLAAHSYIGGIRFSNTTNLQEYINTNEESKQIQEIQTKYSMEQEYMLLGLRLIEGVSIQKFKTKFSENPIFIFKGELNKLVREELIQITDDKIKLTNKGLDLANLVWMEFT